MWANVVIEGRNCEINEFAFQSSWEIVKGQGSYDTTDALLDDTYESFNFSHVLMSSGRIK